jgi:signal transduction histidine kinase
VTRILLLLDHAENQQLLARELERRYQVVVADTCASLDQQFDLCVVDGPSLDRHWEEVQRRKEREEPCLLPVLLVTSRPDVKMITRHVWRSVDELIVMPIEKPELWARVQVLLRARALSRELQAHVQEAEQAAHTRDEVLAVVAHDLRNPLNLVLSNALLLLETVEGVEPRAREQLKMIARASGQMNRLIQDLLEVAGMEAGNIAVDPRAVAVEPLVRDACEMQAHAAEARGVTLSCHCEPGLPRVFADHDRIQQVFGNLIGNALKFTPEGGRVHLHAQRLDGMVRFSVSDTGSGIGADDLPRVFDRFWQAQRSRDGGAGLGLAISRGIVVAHQGDMWVESESGRGSTFLFTLPAAETVEASVNQ